jgi:hypothetical protein
MMEGYCFASRVVRVCRNLGSAEDSHRRISRRPQISSELDNPERALTGPQSSRENYQRTPKSPGPQQSSAGPYRTAGLLGKLPADPSDPSNPWTEILLGESSTEPKIPWTPKILGRLSAGPQIPQTPIILGPRNSLDNPQCRTILNSSINTTEKPQRCHNRFGGTSIVP